MHVLVPFLLVAASAAPASNTSDSGDLLRRVAAVLSDRYYDEDFRERIDELAAPFILRAADAGSLAEERAVVDEFLAQVPVSHLGLLSERAYRSMFAELQREERWMYGFQLARLPEGWFVDWVGSPFVIDQCSVSCGSDHRRHIVDCGAAPTSPTRRRLRR